MPMTADQPQAQTATPIDLGAIFVSLELSKSTWLVTALSPGSEKMSRHAVTGGDIAGLFSCFTALRQKAQRRKDRLYPLVVIQEAGLDGFWLGECSARKPGSRAILWRLHPLPCRAGIAGQRLTESMEKH